MRLLCLFRLHSWRPLKWGVDFISDCRDCRRCGRFEIVAYGDFIKPWQGRALFEPTREAAE